MKTIIPSGATRPLIYDEADADLVEQSRWSIAAGKYPARRRGGRLEYLHRLIAGDRDGLEVDHTNGDTFDVRRGNLRHIPHRMNARNLRNRRKNMSVARGVSLCKRSQRWKAYATIDGRQRFLGRFDSADEAAAVARAFRERHMEGATS